MTRFTPTVRRLGLLLAASAATAIVAAPASGQTTPPQSAIDNAGATWAAKARLLGADGRPLFAESPSPAWIDNASATWAAKARLLGYDGHALPTRRLTPAGTTGAFDWADFAVGVLAMFGAVLLAGGLAGVVRYGRRARMRQA